MTDRRTIIKHAVADPVLNQKLQACRSPSDVIDVMVEAGLMFPVEAPYAPGKLREFLRKVIGCSNDAPS